MSQTSSCQAESLSISSCTATSGQQCVFPFRYKGVVYTQCTSIDQSQPWCSTSVTASGNHQKHFKQNGYVQGVTDTISLGGQKSALHSNSDSEMQSSVVMSQSQLWFNFLIVR